MGIRKLYKEVQEINDKIEDLEVRKDHLQKYLKNRWQFLIGVGCGYFSGDWYIDNDTIGICYTDRCGDFSTDRIPIECFELEDENEAKKKWTLYLEDKERETEEKYKAQKIKEAKKILKNYGEL